LAVTNANNVRLCFDNDAKSAALAARNPRHGNAPEISNESFTPAVRELGWRAVAWPPTVIECHKWLNSFNHLVGAGEKGCRNVEAE